MIKIGIILSMMFAYHAAHAQSMSCAQIHFKPLVEQTIQMFEGIDLQKIGKNLYEREKPDWTDYDVLAKLAKSTETLSALERKKIQSLLDAKFDQKRGDLETLVRILDKEGDPGTAVYLDYNIAYFRLMEKVNKNLGFPFFPIPSFRGIKSDSLMIKEAEALVSRLEEHAQRNYEITGFKTHKEFIAAYKSKVSKSEQNLDLVRNNMVIAMHRPESARFWIPISGFQNQRITGSSKGSMYTESGESPTHGRNTAEANLANMSINDYSPLSPRFKPNYAEAIPSHQATVFKPETSASRYGDDLWIIKPAIAAKRATWTPDDSLGTGWGVAPSSTNQTFFIPWSLREWMLPHIPEPHARGLNPFRPERSPKMKFQLGRWQHGSYGYFEVQVWGPLTINDVQALRFRGTPPDKALYDLLVSKEIEVWDERSWPPKPYFGEESQ